MWRNEQGWHRIRGGFVSRGFPVGFPTRIVEFARSRIGDRPDGGAGRRRCAVRRSSSVSVPAAGGRRSRRNVATISRPARASRRATSAGVELPVAQPRTRSRARGGGRARRAAGSRCRMCRARRAGVEAVVGGVDQTLAGAGWRNAVRAQRRSGSPVRSRRDRAAAGRRPASRRAAAPGARPEAGQQVAVVDQVLDAVESAQMARPKPGREARMRAGQRARSSARRRGSGTGAQGARPRAPAWPASDRGPPPCDRRAAAAPSAGRCRRPGPGSGRRRRSSRRRSRGQPAVEVHVGAAAPVLEVVERGVLEGLAGAASSSAGEKLGVVTAGESGPRRGGHGGTDEYSSRPSVTAPAPIGGGPALRAASIRPPRWP